MTTTTADTTITNEQIEALREEALDAGDLAQSVLCRIALDRLDGHEAARAECVRVIRAAHAMRD
jgi:hypothetical protein